MKEIAKLTASVAICEAAGLAGSFATRNAIPSLWYSLLKKPSFNPPGWVFGPVWTVLYALMGIAAYEVQKKKDRRKGAALGMFGVQLILNIFWSVVFFGLRLPRRAFVEIIFLWISIVLTIVLFSFISKRAALLLVPYLIWTSFAAILNFSIAKKNG